MSVKAVVRWCCERRYVDVNTRNNADYTALHESCAAGHCQVASCLIQFGADVHAISKLDGARSVTGSSSSGNEYYLGGIIALADLYKYSIQIPYLLFTPYHIM